MNLHDYFKQNFCTLHDQWEKSLRSELKLEDVSGKISKKTPEGPFKTLSLGGPSCQLNVREPWKRASQTYGIIPKDIEAALKEDLEAGVKLFFFHKSFLTSSLWEKISKVLSSQEAPKELLVFLLGEGEFESEQNSFQLIDEKKILSGKVAAQTGGNNIQELALLTRSVIDSAPMNGDFFVGVYLDSDFFRNIAKIRAAKLVTQKVLEELGSSAKFFLVGLTNYRDWTLYERYSNMLRNSASVASGYIGGCDFVQSSGYQILLETEGDVRDDEHSERSLRMARNTSHILALESQLGVVEDASFGSFHLESLTEEYARLSWELMQRILSMSSAELQESISNVRQMRLKNISTRKHVLAGLNDFPDIQDSLNLKTTPKENFFRGGRGFENLRLRVEKMTKRPKVYLGVFGDYATLNARMNFAKNYFELLGLEVTDPGKGASTFEEFQQEISVRPEEFLVFVAKDDHYAEVTQLSPKAKEKFIAGKFEAQGFKNLYAGQDVLEFLTSVVEAWESK